MGRMVKILYKNSFNSLAQLRQLTIIVFRKEKLLRMFLQNRA